MWSFLIIPAALLLLLTPPLRPVLTWLIAMAVGPVMTRTKHKVQWGDVGVAVDEQTVPTDVRGALSDSDARLAAEGFVLRGTWRLDKPDGVSTLHLRVHEHPETKSTCTVTHTAAFGTMLRRTVTIGTKSGSRLVQTTDYPMTDKGLATETRLASMPSLTRADWLWRVHRAVLERAGISLGDPLPGDAAGWMGEVQSGRRKDLENLRRRGILGRPNRAGVSRFTWRGCVMLTLGSVWPMKQRGRRRVLDRERTLLHELGLSALLEEAARSGETAARERTASAPTGTASIADDRASPRTIATQRALQTDERRGDPRFRAVVQQSQAARQAQYRTSAWIGPAMFVAVFAARMFLHVPFWASLIVIVGAMLVLFAFLNIGRAFAAEKAAADTLLRRGLCASCLYGLGGLEVEGDGCLVCPECGGAWKASRVKEFASFSTAGDESVSGDVARQVQRAAGIFGLGDGPFAAHQRRRGVDDRGAPCVLVSAKLRTELAAVGAGASEPAAELRRRLLGARRRISSSGLVLRWGIAAVVFVLFAALPAWAMYRVLTMRAFVPGYVFVPLVVGLVMAVLLGVGAIRGNIGYSKKRIVRGMLDEGLCPSCADRVAGLAVQPDGCVLCSCGAAWRVAPPTMARPAERVEEVAATGSAPGGA